MRFLKGKIGQRIWQCLQGWRAVMGCTCVQLGCNRWSSWSMWPRLSRWSSWSRLSMRSRWPGWSGWSDYPGVQGGLVGQPWCKENIWCTWSKLSDKWEKWRFHACDMQTNMWKLGSILLRQNSQKIYWRRRMSRWTQGRRLGLKFWSQI